MSIEHRLVDVRQQFRTAMRRQACTVAIVTIGDGAQARALVATSVVSVSTEPPTLLFCVNRSASLHPAAIISARFCISFLSTSDLEIAKHCTVSKGIDRFRHGDWKYDDDGTPWLASAQACIFGSVFSEVECHSHSIVLGHVDSAAAAAAVSPLLYADGRYGFLQHF